MMGVSYGGIGQLFTAQNNPPHHHGGAEQVARPQVGPALPMASGGATAPSRL